MRRTHLMWVVAIVALSAALWYPRRYGPLDLRYDAGVYYILGTSLAEGRGYRILSEPGAIEAIQYPPGLPALAAVHQWVLGTHDADTVAHALRITFAGLFLLLGLGVYFLTCRYLAPPWAFAAAALTLMQGHTVFLSDLFFADLPYALATVLFFLIVPRALPSREARPYAPLRRIGAAALAVVSYLIRTAGVALFVAWVGESILRLRLGQAARRAVVALIPLIAWQAYTSHVKHSAEYQHPAYTYQRAGYQFYNVSYLDNLVYLDPFAPERGYVDAAELIRRVGANLEQMPLGVGEAVSVEHLWWTEQIKHSGLSTTAQRALTVAVTFAVVLITLLVLGGLVVLAWRGEWLIPLYVAGSIMLICITPWPGQFSRYLMPLAPFLALGLVTSLAGLWKIGAGKSRLAMQLAVGALLLVIVTQQAREAGEFLNKRRRHVTYHLPNGELQGYRLFFYDRFWQRQDQALDWLGQTAPKSSIVATSTPHWFYVHTGIRAVMPPFELDPVKAQRLLDSVPVDYLVVDHLEFVNVGQRYTIPVVTKYPDRWRMVYTTGDSGSTVYQRVKTEPVSGR
ncbi:MAG TPA: hypothetical protein VFL95_07870 [Gemmatimonadales bacterium]|nr:hypothetical protein [Gemmatimonadales bacterium]